MCNMPLIFTILIFSYVGENISLLGPISFYTYLQYAITHSPNGMCPYFLHFWIRGGKNKEKGSSFYSSSSSSPHTPLFKGTLRDPHLSLTHASLQVSTILDSQGLPCPFLPRKSLLKLQKVTPSRTLSLPLILHTSHTHWFVKT
jgi:hypothetical protein